MLLEEYDLEVIQQDIDLAIARHKDLCRECVVGRALQRKFPNAERVASYNDDVDITINGERTRYDMDKVGCDLDEFNNIPAMVRNNRPVIHNMKPCIIKLTKKSYV